MNGEQFTKVIKLQTSDAAVSGIIRILTQPPGRKPSETLLRLSNWYNRLGVEDKEKLREALREVAEMAVFGFFCVLDGVSAIEDEPTKGELELYFVKDGEKIRINDPRQEELHNLFNAQCSSGSANHPENPDIHPYDSDEARNLKSRLKSSDELDIHHVPDKYLSVRTVKDYDPSSAPAIALPKSEHRQLLLPKRI